MRDQLFVPSAQVQNDLDAISEAHRLSRIERDKLARIVIGAIPGNRDRPLHALARALQRHADRVGRAGEVDLFGLLADAACGRTGYGLSRLSVALLDFLATMDGYQHFDSIADAVAAITAEGAGEDGFARGRSLLSASLHRYRVDHMPYETRRQAFTEIHRWVASDRAGAQIPGDGDAIAFWAEMAEDGAWTTYVATLAAFDDFREARTLRTSASAVSLDALAEAGFDAAIGMGDETGRENASFDEAIESVATAKIKVLKGVEVTSLKRVAAVSQAMTHWPRCGVAALTFGPVQNVLVQLKRDHAAPEKLAEVAACLDFTDYDSQISELTRLARSCRDVMSLYAKLAADAGLIDGTGPAASTLDADTEKRIIQLLRRRSFAELTSEELLERLGEVVPGLVDIEAQLAALLRGLAAWPETARREAMAADRAAFANTFSRLYVFSGG